MDTQQSLREHLRRIDGRGYPAYKDLRGRYDFGTWTLAIDHVQGDPFATPSKVRLRVPQRLAAVPGWLIANHVRRVALQDFLARQVRGAAQRLPARRQGSGKSGSLTIDAGHQEVLERTACVACADWVEVRMEIGLPADGRRVLGQVAERLLCDDLPVLVEQGLRWAHLDGSAGEAFVRCVENQEHVRAQLDGLGLVAFIAEGARLPRESGASDRPMPAERAIAFASPPSLTVTMELAHPVGGASTVTGMGLPRGVTLIVGGGYHGKSTLIEAIQRGVYPHIPGDGREGVVTVADAVKIRAEDGRRVERVDIHPFISNLPFGGSTEHFCSDDASGSTSQAANIMEALELGCTTLLIDEDTSATNFMVRDARMQALVHQDDEPITPFIDRVRELYETLGVSTILVVGGSGDYFDVADTVVRMKEYVPYEVTARAKDIAAAFPTRRNTEQRTRLGPPRPRFPLGHSVAPSATDRRFKVGARGEHHLRFGEAELALTSVEQLVDASQTHAIAFAMLLCARHCMAEHTSMRDATDACLAMLSDGLDALAPFGQRGEHPGNFARFRRFELAAALNRLRSLQVGGG